MNEVNNQSEYFDSEQKKVDGNQFETIDQGYATKQDVGQQDKLNRKKKQLLSNMESI